jgi:hypothetical protein
MTKRIVLPDTIMGILQRGGSVRISCEGLLPQTMQQYVMSAASSEAKIEFVAGDAVLLPDTMFEIAILGRGSVMFDFAK